MSHCPMGLWDGKDNLQRFWTSMSLSLLFKMPMYNSVAPPSVHELHSPLPSALASVNLVLTAFVELLMVRINSSYPIITVLEGNRRMMCSYCVCAVFEGNVIVLFKNKNKTHPENLAIMLYHTHSSTYSPEYSVSLTI